MSARAASTVAADILSAGEGGILPQVSAAARVAKKPPGKDARFTGRLEACLYDLECVA